MKIVYLIESDAKCGANRTIYEHVNRLIKRGHELKVLSLQGKQPEWFPLNCKVSPFSGSIPEAEILVSTSSATARLICQIKRGIPFHYQLNYSTILREDASSQKACEEVYHLPVNILCNATWLQNLFRKKFNRESVVISNAIDHDVFKPKSSNYLRRSSRKRILLMYHIQPTKGIVDGLSAFNLVKKRYPQVELVMFGVFPRPYIENLPFFYFFNPTEEELSEIYSSCDVFIFPSIIDGMPKPPLEAMACRTAVVTTDCLGIRDYAEDNKTALVVPPGEPEAMADAVIKLLKDEKLRERIAYQGYRKAQEFRYERVIDRLIEVFQKAIQAYYKKPPDEWSDWEKVLLVSPKDCWAHYKFGVELKDRGDLKRAEEELEEAIRLDPNFTPAYRELEEIFTTSKERKNLRKAWELLRKQCS
jgi:glycosyltransferase involved in cell wall biosynthesis